jgi:hypothetical protein
MKKPVRTATSPDGILVLELFEEDDWYVGFRGHAWHTHGDLLVPDYGATPKEAALAFFESVVGDCEVICVLKREADSEVWVTDDPDDEARYVEEGEVFCMRRWSGAQVQ